MSDQVDPFRLAVAQLARFPGIGERTATRLAYWLLRQPPEAGEEIAAAIAGLGRAMGRCTVCCNLSGADPCFICQDSRRDPTIICVVEQPQDVPAIDGTGEFRGRFHVLHGAISPLEGVGPDDLRIRELLARLSGVREVILATDPDVEGDATALYLSALLRPLGLRVTRLAHGIAVGTELEYADRSSVARALENRREI